jgi:glyoxylate utilization-related uncharacterized protein
VNCIELEFPTYTDGRGSLTVVEAQRDIPFDVKRVFYITAPMGRRGGHAHRACHQVIVAVAGEFDVAADGQTFTMYDPAMGLYVPPGVMISMANFTPDAVCLVFASEHYDKEDYIYE